MEVIHNIDKLRIKKNINENIGFLLTNKKGGYCSFFNVPTSRYQGLFYFDDKTMNMYKFIENIEIINYNYVDKLKNNFYFVERTKGNLDESFFMPKSFNSLIYELNKESEADVILDCKSSYDNRIWGRYYNISEERDCIVAKFIKKTSANEGLNDNIEECTLYLAIKSDLNTYKKNDKWIERHYPYDEERKSPPFKRYVYNALMLKGSKFVFSMSKNKNSAINECKYIFNRINQIKRKEKKHFSDILQNKQVESVLKNKRISKDVKIAYINALNSLNNLIVYDKKNYGIFAGLPWFFQFWSRDTLVSSKPLSKINNNFAKKLILNYLNAINKDGRIQNLVGADNSSNLGSADAHGWLFFRCNDFVKKSPKGDFLTRNHKNPTTLDYASLRPEFARPSGSGRIFRMPKIENSSSLKYTLDFTSLHPEFSIFVHKVKKVLKKSIDKLMKYHTKDNFEFNDSKETWMDTDFGIDDRKGFRIEIQALRLNMYQLMFELTENKKYKILENLLTNKLRQKFWDGLALADGIGDFTIRPNIFIAAYVYPKFLSSAEWEICFDNGLKKLWLDWGGITTIDKNNPLFTDTNTGEEPKSYHRGDSWFWLNDLAALVLHGINKNKFNKNIKKIISASTEEILWRGCIGCHAELSSARELSSKGCFNQSWSNAMYVELIDEVYG